MIQACIIKWKDTHFQINIHLVAQLLYCVFVAIHVQGVLAVVLRLLVAAVVGCSGVFLGLSLGLGIWGLFAVIKHIGIDSNMEYLMYL